MINKILSESTLVLDFITLVLVFIIGFGVGLHAKQEEQEQKLCKLKQYEYCEKEQLLNKLQSKIQ